MNDVDPETDPTATTLTARRWASTRLDRVQAKIAATAGSGLTPELAALAKALGPSDGGWPRWLVVGLALEHFERWYESASAPVNTEPESTSKRTRKKT